MTSAAKGRVRVKVERGVHRNQERLAKEAAPEALHDGVTKAWGHCEVFSENQNTES